MSAPPRAKSFVPLALLFSVGALHGCKVPQAYGDRNSLILRADSAFWSAYKQDVEQALEPRIFTVRPERTFHVTWVDSEHPEWSRLRLWQQVLIFGRADDPLVTSLMQRGKAAPEPWSWVQVEDVWARDQVVTVLVLPPVPDRASLQAKLRELNERLDAQYRAWVRERMFVSGVNDSLMGALRARGFSLVLPKVYDFAVEDSFFLFRNAYPDPSSLIRSLLVTWVLHATPTLEPRSLREWRERVDERFYAPPQDIQDEALRFDTVMVDDKLALELRGVWQDRSDFPAAGAFIARAIPCPAQKRLYYMDAWLYAPGKDKYQYMLQLETLLDSFRCAS